MGKQIFLVKGLGNSWMCCALDPFHEHQGQEVVLMAFCTAEMRGRRELGTQITLLSIQGMHTRNISQKSKNIYFTHGYLQIVQVVTRIHQLGPSMDGVQVYPVLSYL